MLIRLGYDIQFYLPAPIALVTLLHVHPSRDADLREPDTMHVEPELPITDYTDSFGNRCSRLYAPAGWLRLHGSTLIVGSDEPDEVNPEAVEHPVQDLPSETLQFLLNSRYCEVDRLSATALDLFGTLPPGWSRVHAVNTWVNRAVQFGYQFARPTKTALDVYTERTGVCRDFQHLAITFCRALNIPARYATGYLGDFAVPPAGTPMDFSAWYEVFLSGRWWTCDARHNRQRLGRVLMATGRDASDVALTTSFGTANLRYFYVVSDWLDEPGKTPASPIEGRIEGTIEGRIEGTIEDRIEGPIEGRIEDRIEAEAAPETAAETAPEAAAQAARAEAVEAIEHANSFEDATGELAPQGRP